VDKEEEYVFGIGYCIDYWGIPIAVTHEFHDDAEVLSIWFLCFYLSVEITEVT